MSEFSAAATLTVEPSDSSLRATRREIERELGDIEVSVTANRPTGADSGAVGNRGPEPAGIDLNRRQLGQLEGLTDLAEERNDLLDELLDGDLFDGGGGGGGGAGAGSTLLQVQGARSVLGGFGAGLGGARAAGLAGRLGRFAGPLAAGTVGAELSRRFFPVEGVRKASGFEGDEPVIDQLQPSDVIGDPLDLGVDSILADPLSINPGDIIDQLLSLDPTDIINRPVDLSTDDVVQPFDAGPRMEGVDLRALGGDPTGQGAITPPLAGPQGRNEFRRADPSISQSIDVTNTVQVSASMERTERQRFEQAERRQVEQIVDQGLRQLEQKLRRELGGGTSARTTTSGGGRGPGMR